MSTRALITGVGGFAGSHLADLLVSLGWSVSGTVSPGGSRANVAHLAGQIEVMECDIRVRDAVHGVLESVRPDVVFHLAAKTRERETREEPAAALDVTVMGTHHLLQSLLELGRTSTNVLVAGSSAEYGRLNADENPIRETQPFRPVGMYGVTKIAQEMLAVQYHLAHGVPIVRTRAFNHTGPRQADDFAVPAFARQIAEIEAGLRPPVLRVGDLSQSRDLSDVRDVVRGYHAAMTLGVPGEVYNIAAGSAVRTGDVLERLLAMSSAKIEVAVDSERLRPGEVSVQVGDAGKLSEKTGWRPQISLDQTLRDTLMYWRERVTR